MANLIDYTLYDIMESIEYIFRIPNNEDEYLLFIFGKSINIHWKVNKEYIEPYDKNSKVFQYIISDLQGYTLFYITFYDKASIKYLEESDIRFGFDDIRIRRGFLFHKVIQDVLLLYHENIMSTGRLSIKPFNFVFYYPRFMIDKFNSLNHRFDKILPRYGFKKKFLIKDLPNKKMKVRKLSDKQHRNLISILLR